VPNVLVIMQSGGAHGGRSEAGGGENLGGRRVLSYVSGTRDVCDHPPSPARTKPRSSKFPNDSFIDFRYKLQR
jgi:hypothetical protein